MVSDRAGPVRPFRCCSFLQFLFASAGLKTNQELDCSGVLIEFPTPAVPRGVVLAEEGQS